MAFVVMFLGLEVAVMRIKSKYNKQLFSRSISIKVNMAFIINAVEVGRVLVALPDFKSGVSG